MLPAAAPQERNLVLLQKEADENSGDPGWERQRDQQANEMVFLQVRGQMESPSLTHKAA